MERLIFIRRCRDFGFPIEQVKLLASLSISVDRDCSEVREVAKAHLSQIRTKLAELQALERDLDRFVERCEEACCSGPGIDCVVFHDLSRPDTERPG
ncbi:MerR family DNA-binding protein [Paracoccus caeni]|uniref:MerR family DNA-binding protein n=1 Tax=Paracoccus caeni TaxID=657651 RepID=UPI002D80AEBA|nr:MerR family DNA-binding protein [Paracoccus caeni]